MSLLDMLKQYAGGSAPTNAAEVNQHFDQAAQSVPQNVLADALSHAFRSDQTPQFGQMISAMFSQSNGEQKAGMLNQLLSSVGPGTLASIGGGGILSSLLAEGAKQVTPEQAQNVSPGAVEQMATHAEKNDPSIVDRAGEFYSQHPTLVKTLGAGVLSIAMAKMAKREAA
ncbi:MAG TPA: hypothetical protein VKW78_22435 [Terriglobales bacterium]|jgi:hypothetical protein|nr:hypothetical protein [Terriglobales bacterium]